MVEDRGPNGGCNSTREVFCSEAVVFLFQGECYEIR